MNTSELKDWLYPPTAVGEDPKHQVLSDVTGAAADNYDWATALGTGADGTQGNRPPGSVFVVLEATTTPVYVRFKAGPPNATAAAAATTAANGLLVSVGTPRMFYVNPEKHGVLDHFAPAGAGLIQIQVCSPVGQRNFQ